MPFPLSYSGRTAIDVPGLELARPDAAARAAATIAGGLRKKGAFGVVVEGASVAFKSHPWAGAFVLGSRPLGTVSRGSISVALVDGRLFAEYSVRCTYVALVGTVGMAFIAAPMAREALVPGSLVPWWFIPVGWMWLVGGNFLFSKFGFGRLLRRVAAQSLLVAP
jgi:hypothetical protein